MVSQKIIGTDEAGRVRSICRATCRTFATGVLVAGLMLSGGNARAQEPTEGRPSVAGAIQDSKPAEEKPAEAKPTETKPAVAESAPKSSLGVSLGAGYDAMRKESRIFSTISGSLPLPLRMKAFTSLGVAAEAGGAKIEESTLELSHRTGPITVAGGMYTSAHLWTDKLSPYGTLSVRLPRGFSLSGDYVYLVGLEHPHLVLLKVGEELLDGKVSLFIKGGWTIPDGWSARVGASFTFAKDFPVISIDSVVMGSGKRATFSDTVLFAGWTF